MPWNTIATNKATTSLTFGGDLGNKISQLFTAVDIASSDATNIPKVRTLFRFVSGKFQLYDSNETNTLTFVTPSLISSVSISFPTNLTNIQNNEILFKDLAQTITGKTMDANVNVFSNISNANISSSAAISWSKVSKLLSKLEDVADINITNRVTGSSLQWNASTQKWEIYQVNPNPDINLPNKISPPTATTTLVPVYRNDLDVNNQRGYISKIENGQTVLVRFF